MIYVTGDLHNTIDMTNLSIKNLRNYCYWQKASHEEITNVIILGDFGLRTSFNFGKFFISREPNFHIGLSLMNVGIALENEGIDLGLPTKINAGIAWQFFKPVTITLEAQKPINLSNVTKSVKSVEK